MKFNKGDYCLCEYQSMRAQATFGLTNQKKGNLHHFHISNQHSTQQMWEIRQNKSTSNLRAHKRFYKVDNIRSNPIFF